jgi:uncharacterized protein YjiS (DUF1127 family)
MEGKSSYQHPSAITDRLPRPGTPCPGKEMKLERTMVHLLSSERPSMAAASSNPFVALVNWLTKARARRVQRVALESLLEYDVHRLADLGINRQDLFEALDSPSQRPGLRLAQRRAESSRNWLNP